MNSASVFLVAFFTSALTAVGTVYLVERLDVFAAKAPAVSKKPVPSLVGLSEADARVNLRTSGLSLLVGGREAKAGAKEGTVLRQSIAAGQELAEGQPVTVVLAEAMPKVPALLGKTLAEARAMLEKAGFRLKEGDPVASGKVALGQVAAQEPADGELAAKDAQVAVRLSSGPASLEVPKVAGFSLNNAKKKLEEAGFKAAVRWVDLAETRSYVVLNQKPKAGEKLKPGEAIQITVNRGD